MPLPTDPWLRRAGWILRPQRIATMAAIPAVGMAPRRGQRRPWAPLVFAGAASGRAGVPAGGGGAA